jgi:hypothetical protein
VAADGRLSIHPGRLLWEAAGVGRGARLPLWGQMLSQVPASIP